MLRRLLAAFLLICPAIAHAEWHEASSDHFVVYGDSDPEYLKTFTQRLESFDKALRILRNVPDHETAKAQRVTIYALGSIAAVQRLFAQNTNGLRLPVGGFYLARAGGAQAFVPLNQGNWAGDLSSQAILLHEYTHHFMRSTFPDAALPPWLTEGVAEFSAAARFPKNGDLDIGLPVLYRARGLFNATPMPLREMLAGAYFRNAVVEADAFYGRAWLLTHFLTFDKARTGQLDRYVDAINKGVPAARAAEVFGDLDVMERQLDAYMRGGLASLNIPAGALTIRPVSIRKLRPGEAAMMSVRVRSKRGVTSSIARDIFDDAVRRAKPYPDDPAAQVALAEAAFDASDLAAADAAANRALAVEPKNLDALLYKGRVQVAAAVKAKDQSAETWTKARTMLASANRADPDNPVPLIDYYTSFLAARVPPTANAKLGLARAFEIAPEDRRLRILMIRQLLLDGKPDEARTAIAPLAYLPHAGGIAVLMRDVLTALDSGGTTVALGKLEAAAQANLRD